MIYIIDIKILRENMQLSWLKIKFLCNMIGCEEQERAE